MKMMTMFARRGLLCLLAMLLTLAVVPTFSLSSAAASGKTYYVAANGKDDNDGRSEDSPLSFFKANATVFNGGDRVLFKRGDTFYGEFKPLIYNTNNQSRVEVGAYGSGALPIISLAKIVSSPWTNAGNGFYKFVLTKGGNYKGVNNNVANVGFMKDAKGNYYGRRFKTAAECTKQYDFYCDNTAIYVKSSKDPYAALGTLTMNTHGLAVKLFTGMNVHDLHIQYCGYGMSSNSKKSNYIRVYDCVIDNIGGTVINVENHTRAGNAIELYDAAENVVIENNIMRNCFDVAFTCQGSDPGIWRNITVKNNIIAYNTQALEIWCGATSGSAGVNVLNFTDNLCIKNGEGWASHARGSQSCDVLTYGYSPNIWRMSIEKNTFYHSEDISSVYNIHPPAMEKFIKLVTVDNNQAYQLSENSNYLYNRANVGGPAEYAGLQLNFAKWQEFTGLDKNSKITYIRSNGKYRTMEQIALTSLDFDEIAQAAKAAGLSFTLKYDTGSKPTTTTTTTTTTKVTTTTTTVGNPSSASTTNTSATVSDGETTQPVGEPSSDADTDATTTQPNEQTDAPAADNGGNGPSVWLFVGIGGGVLLVAAAVVVLLMMKKKQG